MAKAFEEYIVASDQRAKYMENLPSEETCIFCEAAKIKGPKKIKNSCIVATFDKIFLVVNAFPYAPKGQLMVVPKRHVLDTDDLSKDEILEIFDIIKKAKDAIKKEYKDIRGFNVGINIGKGAGASLSHLHVHVVPRFTVENAFMETTGGTRVIHENPEVTMNRLSKYFI